MRFLCCKANDTNKVEIVLKFNCCNRKKLTYTFDNSEGAESTDQILQQIKTMLDILKDS
jgi:hypothetical protein